MKSTVFLRFFTLHIVLFSLFRLAFLATFCPQDEGSLSLIVKALKLGLRFDMRLASLLLLPLLLFSWFRWGVKNSTSLRGWVRFYSFLSLFWAPFYIFDFGFYSYLNSRMNSSVFLFLENPAISFEMMWQSYPVVWIVIAFIGCLFLYAHLLRRFVFRLHSKTFFGLPAFVNTILFLAVFVLGLYGHFSQYPLRWSEAFFSSNHFASHLALNPVLYFFESYEFSAHKDFDEKRLRQIYPEVASYFGVPKSPSDKLSFAREVVPQSSSVKAPNVVIIIMESLAFSKTNLSENPLSPTPAVADLAKESYWFSNHFSPSEGTARNIFSIMTAIPDVTKVQTSTRNPLVVDQRLIANAYKKYRKMYFIGGSASWANIRGIFSHNIDGIEMYEEDAFDKNKTDVWGGSDLDLFIEAHERFKQVPENQPFFAVIQSASFHRPYTIPKKALEFKTKDVPIGLLKEAGFYSLEQYNSLRFADYSLGHFLKLAKKSPYYKNTLFVVTGDHGLPDDSGVNVEKGMHTWELEKYHVPLILHHKGLFPETHEDKKMSSHLDIMTSVASLAGITHENTTLGRDLFNRDFDKERYSFVYNYYSELNTYGLIGPEFYLQIDDKHGAQLFQQHSSTPDQDLKEKFPEVYERMKLIAEGYLQSGRYLLFHNSKKEAGRNQPQK